MSKICIINVCQLFPSLLYRSANANEINDIEFTVCELNCHSTQHHDDQNSPPHERKPRFSSFKKSGAVSKAIRNKLNLSKSSSEKQSSTCESGSSFDHEKVESHATMTSASENGNFKGDLKESSSSSGGTLTGDKQAPQTKVTKKKSKLCLLL